MNVERDVVNVIGGCKRNLHLEAIAMEELKRLSSVDKDALEARTASEGTSRNCAQRVVRRIKAWVEDDSLRGS